MLDTDEAFLNEANEKIARKNPNEEFLIKGTNKKKIVFAIISEEPGKRPHLPLFSKILTAPHDGSPSITRLYRYATGYSDQKLNLNRWKIKNVVELKAR